MPADSHCHINDPAFDEDREEVISKIRGAGIKYILNVGYDIKTSRLAIKLAEQYDFMYAAVGIHPHNAVSLDDEVFRELEKMAERPKVVAMGEMGLDFYRDISPRDVQRKAFRAQIKLAKEKGKPVLIHSRDAMDETIAILKDEKIGEVSGVMHCFSGSVKNVAEVIDLGLYISFACNVTYPKAEGLRSALAVTPGHRLLTETDSPYLSPQGKRGKRNDPVNVTAVLETAAQVRGVTVEDMDRISVTNFETLFGLVEDGDGVIVYKIRNSLYVNLTPHCTNECYFCARYSPDPVQGHNLRITKEPDVEQMIEAIADPTLYEEIVFCGYGEPTLRLDQIKQVAKAVKDKGGMTRLNTNGHANHIAGRDITPELVGLIDSVSVSLNSADSATYNKICSPLIPEAWEKTVDFIRLSKTNGLDVTATIVAIAGKVDVEECRRFVEDQLGVKFRARGHNLVG